MKAAIISVLILSIFLSGCSGIRLKKYDGSTVDDKQLALVYIRNNEGSETIIRYVDGEDAVYAFKSILELKPGAHTFEVYNYTYPLKEDGVVGLLKEKASIGLQLYAVYSMKVELKAGYSYVPVTKGKGLLLLPTREMCFTEEVHASPTARTNFSGEFRFPGLDAPRVGCTQPTPRPPDWFDKHPDMLRRTD